MSRPGHALAGVVALLCVCLQGAPALATPASPESARLHVAFLPDTPGARTTVELSLNIAGAGGGPPSAMRSMLLRLPAGIGVATTTLGEANCTPAGLLAAGLAGCPGNALLGFGTATAIVPVAGGEVVEHASLHPLMGPPRENELEVLFYVQADTPVFAQLVLPAALAEDTPPYGERLLTSVPAIEVWPEGPELSLRKIETTIGPLHLLYHRRLGAKTIAFKPQGVRIPSQCPRGGFPFGALLRFADGTTTSTTYRVRCR